MPGGIETVRTIADLRRRVSDFRTDGHKIGLVPTMGGLHDGHLSLVRRSLALSDRTVATLFVNPTQFGKGEDLETYPRDEARDAALLADEGAHLLFAPDPSEVYPEGYSSTVKVSGLGDILEEEYRPGFFGGVATVVTKLLLQALPDVAVFGEKDYQQLQVIKRLALDLDIPVRIEGVATVREEDGLALASRNAYLTDTERRAAPALYRTIEAVAEKVRSGEDIKETETWAADTLTKSGFGNVDYVTVRDAKSLLPLENLSQPARVLAAAWLGRARLIDNVSV
ncbi:MAG: pantoate--beta-alanine ligase [Rhodospirillaceae bacterium]|jgi:pantoate--beta-alanine ligase|nr:pantoate--beta-alanine ligase [Rhodospirillales bacterium]MBT3905025.1 pantoate--beta-alanine ligase [Rhodospirillaceae bacterium]MBT4703339.1 pantoate--beta-alanine ligase [Rhodospirillaceae bacterium]MBT5034680.1 pantoate--beta-alanine ligase [Rhodospirillaceae bacterium]MBT6218286.1 pantoate--beta-alanine ligase [Rhodospirillaceae bacterium]